MRLAISDLEYDEDSVTELSASTFYNFCYAWIYLHRLLPIPDHPFLSRVERFKNTDAGALFSYSGNCFPVMRTRSSSSRILTVITE